MSDAHLLMPIILREIRRLILADELNAAVATIDETLRRLTETEPT